MTLLAVFPARHICQQTNAIRAAILATFLLVVLAPAAAQGADLFNNTNVGGVTNGPTGLTVFTLSSAAQVTELVTYHWNNARGAVPGTIALRSAGGTVLGPFPAVGSPGQGGAPNVNWTATVSLTLASGTYTVVDSQPATWSQNAQSGGHGFAIVRGTVSSASSASDDQAPAKTFEYAVKFVCGVPQVPVVAPGEYFTAINVHNPSYRPVTFKKKIAVALPGERPGPISRFFEAQLKPDQALEIDCPDILRHAETQGFLKGFVVIETESELDVVAVYTAGHPQVETLEVKRVEPRPVAKAQVVGPSSGGACSGDPVGGVGCCCNEPKPGGGMFPDCKAPLQCVRDPNATWSVCASHVSVNVFLDPTPPINSSQPPFCGQPH